MEPQVLKPKRTEYGKQVRKQYESKQIKESRHNMTELEPRTDGIANTLSTVQKDNLLMEPTASVSPQRKLEFKRDKGFSNVSPSLRSTDYKCPHVVKEPQDWNTIIGSKQKHPFRGDANEISPCITSACGAGGGMTPMLTDAPLEIAKTDEFIEQVRGYQTINYRIRKLTPTECFRLMDVDDADIDKLLNSGISNSQLYKMAGNSIVVNCLYHIFRKIFVDKENESQQLNLF